jgi:hypothetical protein
VAAAASADLSKRGVSVAHPRGICVAEKRLVLGRRHHWHESTVHGVLVGMTGHEKFKVTRSCNSGFAECRERNRLRHTQNDDKGVLGHDGSD